MDRVAVDGRRSQGKRQGLRRAAAGGGGYDQLYAVGTGGDGSAAAALLTPALTTNAAGGFSFTSGYTCPTATTPVYLLATGGNPGLSGVNPNLAEMTALGPCSSMATTGFVTINEVTTVAAVAALAPYMSSPTAVGSGTGDAAGLAAAFTLAMAYADPATGLRRDLRFRWG